MINAFYVGIPPSEDDFIEVDDSTRASCTLLTFSVAHLRLINPTFSYSPLIFWYLECVQVCLIFILLNPVKWDLLCPCLSPLTIEEAKLEIRFHMEPSAQIQVLLF